MYKKVLQGAGIGLLAGMLSLFLWYNDVFEPLEHASWSWRVAAHATPQTSTDSIRIIALDQKSLDWGSQENNLSWPWPRQAYELVLSFCKRAGAKVVALDILFSEPSLYGVGDDKALGRAMLVNAPVVASFTFRAKGQQEGESQPPFLAIKGLGQWRKTSAMAAGGFFTMPVAEIADSAAMLANISSSPDPDGVFRRAPLFSLNGSKAVPSLALAAYLAAQPQEVPLSLTTGEFRVGNATIPIDGAGKSILNFRGPSQAISTFSAAAIIQSELQIRAGQAPTVSPGDFKDRYVFFGLTALGLYDLRTTPIDGVYAGVEVHATMLDNLLARDFLKDCPLIITIAMVLLSAMLSGVLIVFSKRALISGLLFICLLPLPAIVGFVAYGQGYWLPMAMPSVAILFALLNGALFNFATEGRKKRYIKRAFKQYLHPAVIDQLLHQPERLRLGGEKRELTIFFCDLQNFTSLSEQLEPEELTLLLNRYLTAMTDIILECGGTIDKYEGDAILAFWNAPLDQPDHAACGVGAALACQARLAELRDEFRERFKFNLFMRVGVNTGAAVVGNLGSSQRFDYSILGDSVNIASRLEGVNKEFGTPILISESTKERLPAGFVVREIGRVRVVGRQESVTVYEPIAVEADTEAQELTRFHEALDLYYKGKFSESLESFAPLAKHDEPAARYVARCRSLLANPPLTWDGVWKMTKK